MTSPTSRGMYLIAFLTVAFAFLQSAVPAHAADEVIILRCGAAGAGDSSFTVRYVQRVRARGVRKTLSAVFEARAGGAYLAGQPMEILVGSRVVGSVNLVEIPNTGDVGAELKLDTASTAGDVALPFPLNLRIVDSTLVRARINGVPTLGCRVH